MTSNQLIWEGVELMLFGLGSVFIFLVLLIVCIRLMSSVIGRFDSAPTAQLASSEPAVAEVDADLITAIQTAIHQHRARRG
ncbi:OadG family protein [Stutzerimonas stutzeri]|uniref:OadG family protein n=1 Tax=Stutzerimonas stutzeri TaxID=316 RepID=UPI00371ED533